MTSLSEGQPRTDIPKPHESEKTASKIEGVPVLMQRYAFWCGYTSLSMVLQYWGHTELTPERLFEHLHGDRNKNLEGTMERARPPAVETLASMVHELTDLEARILSEEYYKRHSKDPHYVLTNIY